MSPGAAGQEGRERLGLVSHGFAPCKSGEMAGTGPAASTGWRREPGIGEVRGPELTDRRQALDAPAWMLLHHLAIQFVRQDFTAGAAARKALDRRLLEGGRLRLHQRRSKLVRQVFHRVPPCMSISLPHRRPPFRTRSALVHMDTLRERWTCTQRALDVRGPCQVTGATAALASRREALSMLNTGSIKHILPSSPLA